ncbi:hypothetical protein [Ottowia oryzae]
MLACSEEASSEEIWGTSISARSGSPSEDLTVTAPSAKACASRLAPSNARQAALARRPFFQNGAGNDDPIWIKAVLFCIAGNGRHSLAGTKLKIDININKLG